MSFGNVLALLLEERGITQKEMAAACSISTSAISSYVQNAREPDFDMLKKIADYFSVTTDFLLEYKSAGLKNDEDVARSLFRSMTPGQRELWVKQGRHLLEYRIGDVGEDSLTGDM